MGLGDMTTWECGLPWEALDGSTDETKWACGLPQESIESGTTLNAFSAAGSGGFALGGSATITRTSAFALVASGGIAIGGAAASSRTQAFSAIGSGGLVISGSALIGADLSIVFDGIPTDEAFGALEVSYLVSEGLPGIPTDEALGALSLGYSQGIYLYGIPSGERIGALSISGGQLGTKIFIGGIEQSHFLRVGTARISQQTQGRWTATFSLQVNDASWAPSLGQVVLIQDFGRRIFAGCISEIVVDRLLSSVSKIAFLCTAQDKTFICDHRVVTERTYAAGTDITDIMRDVVASFMTGEGLSISALPESLDAIDSDLVINYQSVTSAFDKAAELAGAAWWIDVSGQLQVARLVDAAACPFSLSESSKNWRNMQVKYSMRDFTNAVYVRSNLSTLPSTTSYSLSYTVNQAEAAAMGFYQGACVFPMNVASIVSLKVNGVEHHVYDGLHDPEVVDATNPLFGHVWWMFFGTPYLAPPGSTTSVPSPPEKPSLGELVEIEYIPSVQSTQVKKAASLFAPVQMPGMTPLPGESFGTCGSGLFESVQQVNDIVLPDDLQAIADAIIARYGSVPVVVTFETDVPGGAVGQKLAVDIPRSLVPSTELIITSVDGISLGTEVLQNRNDLKPDGVGSSFRWTIQASTVDLGNWLKFFERLYRRTEHPNPILREQLITFIIAPGSSVTSGTVDTNPKRVTQTCKLTEAYAVAGLAPVDQDLYLNIASTGLGGGYLFRSWLKIPAGSNGLHSTFDFAAAPLYLQKNDVLTPIVSYTITGADPQAAGSVSLDIVGVW